MTYNKTEKVYFGDRPDDGGSKHLWNARKLVPNYRAQ
jgi:hypothetical protein